MIYREEKGITMVTLIITILVLTVLAGISFNMVTENGYIFSQVGESVSEAEESANMLLKEQEVGEAQRQNIYNEIVSTEESQTGAFDVSITANRDWNDSTKANISAQPSNNSYNESTIANYKFYIKESEQPDVLYKEIENVSGKTATTTIETGKQYTIKAIVIDRTGKTGMAEIETTF